MTTYECRHCGTTRDDAVYLCAACGKHKHLGDDECDHDCEWCDSVAFPRRILLDRASFKAFTAAIKNPPPPSPALIALMRDAKKPAEFEVTDMPSTKMEPYTLQGISLGGIYTSIYVPELRVLFDVGMPIRSAANTDVLCLSHGHPDHISGLFGFLGIRGLRGKETPLKILCPAKITQLVQGVVDASNALLRVPFGVEILGVSPGDIIPLRYKLSIHVVPTYHSIPSVGYLIQSAVEKLKPDLIGTSGPRLAEMREAGIAISDSAFVPELAFITDTLVQALDNTPALYKAKVLIIESTFLDDKKTVEDSRRTGHIHLDELNERSALFENKHVALIHFSQMYDPLEVRRILEERAQGNLKTLMWPFLGHMSKWPI